MRSHSIQIYSIETLIFWHASDVSLSEIMSVPGRYMHVVKLKNEWRVTKDLWWFSINKWIVLGNITKIGNKEQLRIDQNLQSFAGAGDVSKWVKRKSPVVWKTSNKQTSMNWEYTCLISIFWIIANFPNKVLDEVFKKL